MHNRQIYQKFIFHLSLFGIAISLLVNFYDVVFGYLFESLHIVFELIEMGLDNLIEHTFETELHETQLIVFYILLVLGSVLIYFVWKVLVELCSGTGAWLSNELAELKTAITHDWSGMTITHRVIYISIFILVNYLASFLLF
jgi:hypothetical protein